MGEAVPPVPTTLPGDISATLMRLLAYMGGLAVLAILAASYFSVPAVIATIEPPPRPEWINVERPHPAFELQMPELVGTDAGYAILRRPADGARKDVMTWGQASGSGPFALVEIDRPGTEGQRFIDAPSEIAARIVAYTVTDDVKRAGQIDSKFGVVPLVDFGIAATSLRRRCLGFARAFDEPLMQIAGWYCSAGDEVVDRATLGCALDRLTMLSAGGDPKLAGLFARAEIKRTFCGQRNPILAATPEREAQVTAPSGAKPPHGAKLRGPLQQR
jgi:hypothetical protein